MKVCAIYNVWADGLDLLPYSIGNIFPVVDGIIVVWSERSNSGNSDLGKCLEYVMKPHNGNINFVQCEPSRVLTSHQNETMKRQRGIDEAKQLGFTHFVLMDCDEFYDKKEFEAEKKRFDNPSLSGLVCGTQVYFKKPTLTIGFDHTLVPFIHKLSPGLKTGNFNHYPFTYDDQGNAHIDPTRRLNLTDGVEWSDVIMHHMSWVRKDYNLKIENSSASKNLKKSSIYRDLEGASEGHYNEFYRSHLTKCDNHFNIPEL
jgi:hypothetical protein